MSLADGPAPDHRYQDGQVTATPAELARWAVHTNGTGDLAYLRGPCPRCTHVFDAPVATLAPMAATVEPAGSAPGESVRAHRTAVRPLQLTRQIVCDCGQEHAERPPTAPVGCGAWWRVSVQKDRTGQWRVAEPDPTMAAAADALAAQLAATDLALVRTTAEKWLAALMALYGLFSLVGAVVAKDTVTDLTSTGKAAVALLGLGALTMAVATIGCGYVAAYGWPRTVEVKDDEQLRAWVANRPRELVQRVPRAIHRLHQAVVCSVVTLVLLSGALALMWLGPRKATAAPVVRVSFTEAGGAQSACGTLKAPTDRALVLRVTDGPLTRDHTIPLASATRIEPVPAC